MMKPYRILMAAALILISTSGFGSTRYGEAEVQKGQLTIVRDGMESVYYTQDGSIEIVMNDVLRAGDNSLVILKTMEATDVTMGSHAVFQVSPWKHRNKTGYLRMLYGKMNFETRESGARRRFRMKTASATLGVKGTGGDCEVGSTGNTGCVGNTGVIEFQGNTGPAQDLTPNSLAMAVGNEPVKPPVQIEPEPEAEPAEAGEPVDTEALAKSPPTSNESASLDQEELAVELGAVDPQDLEESKQTEISADASFEQELEQAEEDKVLDEQAPVEEDTEFESNLQQNEQQYEEITIEADIPVTVLADIPVPTEPVEPDIPEVDVAEEIEDAVQESKDAKGRMILDFEN